MGGHLKIISRVSKCGWNKMDKNMKLISIVSGNVTHSNTTVQRQICVFECVIELTQEDCRYILDSIWQEKLDIQII